MGWLPDSVITSDASLIKDAADPIVLGAEIPSEGGTL